MIHRSEGRPLLSAVCECIDACGSERLEGVLLAIVVIGTCKNAGALLRQIWEERDKEEGNALYCYIIFT